MPIPPEEITIDSLAFRKTMGLFATGVTVMAAEVNGKIYGMTANSVTSVSLEPLLLLVCVHKDGQIMEFLHNSRGFSINILNEDQADLSRFFANMWTEPERPEFKFKPWVGGPRLENAIGSIACRTREHFEGGDHWIVMGEVIDLYRQENPADPLLFYRGQYRRILNQT
jgi:flavin reductase (DIM6/NTAB) family NADH-FMN oxidoreductase RutF